jgi:hypothetical protein
MQQVNFHALCTVLSVEYYVGAAAAAGQCSQVPQPQLFAQLHGVLCCALHVPALSCLSSTLLLLLLLLLVSLLQGNVAGFLNHSCAPNCMVCYAVLMFLPCPVY